MNTDSKPTFAQALAAHQQGEWQKAEQLYQSLLSTDIDNAGLLHLMGILYGQIGQFATAEDI